MCVMSGAMIAVRTGSRQIVRSSMVLLVLVIPVVVVDVMMVSVVMMMRVRLIVSMTETSCSSKDPIIFSQLLLSVIQRLVGMMIRLQSESWMLYNWRVLITRLGGDIRLIREISLIRAEIWSGIAEVRLKRVR
jgi:hypothetical protein